MSSVGEFYSEQFLKELPPNPWEGLYEVSQYFIKRFNRKSLSHPEIRNKMYSTLIDAYGLIASYVDKIEDLNVDLPEPCGDVRADCDAIVDAAQTVFYRSREISRKNRASDIFNRSKERYQGTSVSNSYVIEISDDDFYQMHRLIGDLRGALLNEEDVDENYRTRLVDKISLAENELRQEMSDMNHFWGLYGEARILAAKYSIAGRVLADLIVEIVNHAASIQGRAEGIEAMAPVATPQASASGGRGGGKTKGPTGRGKKSEKPGLRRKVRKGTFGGV